jgi:perosamine synthetase
MVLKPEEGSQAENRIAIAKPYVSEEIEESVLSILRSGKFVQGAFVEKFERALSDYIGCKHVVAVNSGTAALQLAFESLKIENAKSGNGNRSQVATTPLSFAATANAVLHAQCDPVFVDVDPETFNIDSEQVKERVNEKTLAVEPVDVYGLPADLDRINDFARQAGTKVVEDSAESIGATFNDRKIGSISTLSCFSTYATKNLHTGEGGFVTTESDSLAQNVRLLRSQGQASRYNHVVLGYNFRMLEFSAAIGLDQVDKLDDLNRKRRDNALFLCGELQELESLTPQKVPGNRTPAWYMLSFILDEKRAGIKRDKLVTALKERGIEADVSWPVPIHLQPFYREKFGYKQGDYPNAERICATVFQLPIHPFLTHKELERIAKTTKEILAQ